VFPHVGFFWLTQEAPVIECISDFQAQVVGTHLLVVIDQHEARIYGTELLGSVPRRITAFEPRAMGRHVYDFQDESFGQRKPDHRRFYSSVARSLSGAEQIVIFGTGIGASSALDQLLVELKLNYRDVARHIVGAVAVDERHLTEEQLLARARDFYRSALSAIVNCQESR
jgi:hypothetical protein